jgi:hypothetical protein
LERMATGVSPTAGGQALANRMGAVLASYDLAGHMAARQGRWCSEGVAKCPVCECDTKANEMTRAAAKAKP